MNRVTVRNIILLWLAWSIILIGFMQFAQYRLEPVRPDFTLTWSEYETHKGTNDDKPYLLDPFLNSQVAWDSEFYLSIATVGYDDPDIRQVHLREDENSEEHYSMSHAFFMFYPAMMKLVRIPFVLLGLTPIAASTAAGVLVSLLGTLAGMIALYDIVRDHIGEEGGFRVGYMLLLFPTSVFFAVVYTEGLFIGLTFSSLALMRRNNLLPAAVLAVFATWTRAVGITMVIPLLLSWVLAYRDSKNKSTMWMLLPLMGLPILGYVLWRMSYGVPFDFVQDNWFGNGVLLLEQTKEAWTTLIERAQKVPETALFVTVSLTSLALATLSCFVMLRRYPRLAIFGLISIIIPMTSGWTGTNSAIRYVLAIPTLWVMLAYWGRSPVFDRAWTFAGTLLLAIQAFLFTFDFWVG